MLEKGLRETLSRMMQSHVFCGLNTNYDFHLGMVHAAQITAEAFGVPKKDLNTLLDMAYSFGRRECPGQSVTPKMCQKGCNDCSRWADQTARRYLNGDLTYTSPPSVTEEEYGPNNHYRLAVWYIKGVPGRHRLPDWDGFLPGVTHERVKTVHAEHYDDAFAQMQAMNWSPNGEARSLIESLEDVGHTSMSIGDVLVDVDSSGQPAYVCVSSPQGWLTDRQARLWAMKGKFGPSR